ncbi:MAG: Hsp20/alpha crystallin family protein [Candidatus Paceibacterota bacterium]|jgi:HSP20 family protein
MSKEKKSFWGKFTRAVKVRDEDDELENNSEENESEESDDDSEGQLAIDMHQTPTEIVVKTMIAGVKPEDLDISITRDMVTIKGKREESHDTLSEDYFHRELYWGSFSRSIILPQEIEVEDAEAINKNGLLIIRLPKLDKNRQAKLKVKSA